MRQIHRDAAVRVGPDAVADAVVDAMARPRFLVTVGLDEATELGRRVAEVGRWIEDGIAANRPTMGSGAAPHLDIIDAVLRRACDAWSCRRGVLSDGRVRLTIDDRTWIVVAEGGALSIEEDDGRDVAASVTTGLAALITMFEGDLDPIAAAVSGAAPGGGGCRGRRHADDSGAIA